MNPALGWALIGQHRLLCRLKSESTLLMVIDSPNSHSGDDELKTLSQPFENVLITPITTHPQC
jgi:hypothetical protein